MTGDRALREYLLAFADDEHLMGQHHTEWIGVAPFLEEDLALSSIGQDELGHAVMLYELVLELDGVEATDQAIDEVAYRRSPGEYRSSALAEYPATDWAETLVRHWIYDMIEDLRWGLVADSSNQRLRETAARAGREETFHRRHANALLDSLLRSPEAASRLLSALTEILPLVPSQLSPSKHEDSVIAAGIASASLSSLTPQVIDRIDRRFGVELAGPALSQPPVPADRTTRTEHFAPLMARMLEVLDFDPSATW